MNIKITVTMDGVTYTADTQGIEAMAWNSNTDGAVEWKEVKECCAKLTRTDF